MNFSKKALLHNASLAWPMTCNAILLQSVGIIDLLLIASLGESPVAAYGIAGAIVTFIIGIQFAIANGTQLVLSRAVGAGNKNNIGLVMSSAWVTNLSFSIAALISLILINDWLIDYIAHDPMVAADAKSYVNISLLLLLFSSASQVVVVYFNSTKQTRIPLYGFMIEIPCNVICSFILIYGTWGAPELGLAGAAWGSVIAIVIRFIYLAFRLNQEKIKGHISGFNIISKVSIIEHIQEVVPIVANFIVLLTGTLLFQVLFAQLSVAAYAAITLVLPWIKIGSMFANTWAQASTILVSQHIGKKEQRQIPPFVAQSLVVTRIISLFIVLIFYMFSEIAPWMYPNLSSETLIALATIAPVYIVLPLIRTNNMFCGNMIRAMGDSYMIVRINIITQWVISLPLCALMIYLGAPLYIVFGIILFDEILKFQPFRNTLRRRLDRYEQTGL
ncbi:MATE family efflux transporter [Vibrio sp. TH_r3]|uniref:MATE family efflux transporter n=1 Tax=Vibrio sp. TH_r3 TaxID=3082084 RepID=UPI002954D8EE|nr:MATE family efflux transporter [Vibrio sp. TH_r3]MDV7105968.1 MATE family efflux transporter [Vibrio sp. TH_r3]